MHLSILTLTIALCVGIALGLSYSHSSFVLLLLVGIVLIHVPLLFLSKIYHKKQTIVTGVMVMSLVCIVGIIRGQMYEEPHLKEGIENQIRSFSGEVVTIPEIKDTTQVFDVKTSAPFSTTGESVLRVTAALYPEVHAGDTVTITGKIKEGDVVFPSPPETYTSFNYAHYLHTKNIVGILSFPKIEIVATNNNSLIYSLYHFRERLVEKIDTLVPSPENSLASGVLFGTNSLPASIQNEVRTAGLSHIIVLSGFNVSLVVMFVMLLLRYFPPTFRIIISATLLSLFIVMVGGTSLQSGGASLIRAAIMTYVALLGLFLGRETQALYALFFSLALYVLFIPQALLYDVSLHLSFLATLGLIVLSEPIKEKMAYLPFTLPDVIATLLSTTIAVMFLTTPYLMYTFGSFSLYSIFANLLVVPLVPFLMAATFLLVIFSFIPGIYLIFSFLVYSISSYIFFVAHITASLPLSKITAPISFLIMCVLYTIVGILAYLVLYKKNPSADSSIISF